MSDLNISKRGAVLKGVNLRSEFHGTEVEKALDLTVVFSCHAKLLACLFTADEKIIKKLWAADGTALLGGFVLQHQYKLEGMRVGVDKFTFEDCIIQKGLKAKPILNNAFEVKCKLQIHPGSQKCADRLWSFRGEEIKLSIVQVQHTMALAQPDAVAKKAAGKTNKAPSTKAVSEKAQKKAAEATAAVH